MGSSINYKDIEITTSIPADVGQEIMKFLHREHFLISLVGKDEWRDTDKINKEKQLFVIVGLACNGNRYRVNIRGQKIEINYVCPGKDTDKNLEILMVYPLAATSGGPSIKLSLK